MLNKPHRHADLICKWAMGQKIQMRSSMPDEHWVDVELPDWTAEFYRVKPQPEYPKAPLTYSELCGLVNMASRLPGNEGIQTKLARLAADAGIKAFINSGMMRDFIDEGGQF